MLYLSVIGLLLLILGGIIIKVSTKFVGLGIILALIGAGSFVTLGIEAIKDDQSKTAKCASLDGHYGGGACYVQGVEKDLNNIEDFFKDEVK